MRDKPATPIRKFATDQASALLRRTAFQATRTSKLPDAEAVHDLRVSICRLTQCLIVFRQFFPEGATRKVCRKVSALMDLASDVRNHDIALDLLNRAAVPEESSLARTLLQERQLAEQVLLEALKQWSRRDMHKKWRSRLDL